LEDKGGIVTGKLHSECDDSGCGVPFVTDDGRHIEMERDEAVLVPEAFEDECFRDSFCKKPAHYEMTGTISQISSAINTIGGGTNFSPGAKIKKNGRKFSTPRKVGYKFKKPFYVEGGSIVINRTNMLDPKVYTFSGTTYEIASQINSHNGNGVKLMEEGGEVEAKPAQSDKRWIYTPKEVVEIHKAHRIIERYANDSGKAQLVNIAKAKIQKISQKRLSEKHELDVVLLEKSPLMSSFVETHRNQLLFLPKEINSILAATINRIAHHEQRLIALRNHRPTADLKSRIAELKEKYTQ
jgi:hypothetical protein